MARTTSRTRKGLKRAQPPAPDDVGSKDSDLYRCSRCKYVESRDDLLHLVPQLPEQSISHDSLWETCPAEGPKQIELLIDPKEPARQRARLFFSAPNGQEVRVCTPRVRSTPIAKEGKQRISFGPALQLQKIMCEWVLQQQLQHGGPVRSPDLALLWPLHFGTLLGLWKRVNIVKDTDGKWYSPHWNTEATSEWERKLILGWDGPKLADRKVWRELLEIVDPFHTVGEKGQRAKLNATLYVPIDLRFSVQDQLEEIKPIVQEVQDYLLRMCGRQEVYRTDPELIRRNLYVYLLSTKLKMKAPAIARIVFPEETKPGKAAAKVRKIVSDFGRELKRRRDSEV